MVFPLNYLDRLIDDMPRWVKIVLVLLSFPRCDLRQHSRHHGPKRVRERVSIWP